MRRVTFDPNTLTGADLDWWRKWSAKATAANAEAMRLVAQGKDPVFRDDLWSELKEFLLDKVFHHKCGYCEADVTIVAFGDAEHYRPKGKVTVAEGGKARVVEVQGAPHPGYYWLAHEWRNLFPACGRCNTGGKMNHFPVAAAHVSAPDVARKDPDELDAIEKPLLLNPYKDEPTDYLAFDDFGGVAAIDDNDRGQQSIAIFGLMRADLVDGRRREQKRAWLEVQDAIRTGNPSAIVRPYREGRAPFSRAVLAYVLPRLRELIRELQESVV